MLPAQFGPHTELDLIQYLSHQRSNYRLWPAERERARASACPLDSAARMDLFGLSQSATSDRAPLLGAALGGVELAASGINRSSWFLGFRAPRGSGAIWIRDSGSGAAGNGLVAKVRLVGCLVQCSAVQCSAVQWGQCHVDDSKRIIYSSASCKLPASRPSC